MASVDAKLEKLGIPLRQAIAQGKVTAADAHVGVPMDFGRAHTRPQSEPNFRATEHDRE